MYIMNVTIFMNRSRYENIILQSVYFFVVMLHCDRWGRKVQ